ncbi:hypothetical protein PMIN04_013041 [Paraphaeosphaeria minitans]
MISPSDMAMVFTVIRGSFLAPHYQTRHLSPMAIFPRGAITCVITLESSNMNRLKTLAEHLILTFDRDAWQPSSLGATEQALRPSCIGEAVPFNAMQPKMTCSSMILLRHAVTIITLSGYSTCSDQPDRNVGSNTYLGTYGRWHPRDEMWW